MRYYQNSGNRVNLKVANGYKDLYKETKNLPGNFAFICMAGSTGSGKTQTALRFFLYKLLHYSNTKLAIVRKNLTTIKKTTVPSLLKAMHPDIYTLNRSEWTITLLNGSQIIFVEADHTKDPELKKLRGLECTWALIEEGDEVIQKVFDILKTRVGRWNNDRHNVRPEIWITLNPSDGWVKETFYEPWREGKLPSNHHFYQFTIEDNNYADRSIIELLKTMSPEYQERYLNNNWDYKVDDNLLYPYSIIKPNLVGDRVPNQNTPRTLGVDVAIKKDKAVWCYSDMLGIYKVNVYDPKLSGEVNTTEIADKTVVYMSQENVGHDFVVVDGDGLGAGIVGELGHRYLRPPVEYHAGASVPDNFQYPDELKQLSAYKFGNMKAQLAFVLRELLRTTSFSLINHKELIKELTMVKYVEKNGKIYVESKQDIKKRLGHSPDFFDSAIMTMYRMIYRPQSIQMIL